MIDGRAIVRLEQEWSTGERSYQSGDIVAVDLNDGGTELVFSPTDKQAVTDVDVGMNSIFLEMLDNVVGRIHRYTRTKNGWRGEQIPLPDHGVASLVATSSGRDDLMVSFQSAIQPTTLYFVTAENETIAVESIDPLYDASGVVVRQRFAISNDGTEVPYFLIGHEDVSRPAMRRRFCTATVDS